MEKIIYPKIIQSLGGATSMRIGTKSTIITVGGEDIRVPTSKIRHLSNDGIAAANFATAWRDKKTC